MRLSHFACNDCLSDNFRIKGITKEDLGGMMMRKLIILVLFISLFSLSLWPSIQGKIEGIVTDVNGNPLEKVTVTITSLKISTRHFEVNTDKEGKFTQVGIWPDYYLVNFKKSGFLPVSLEVRVYIAESSKVEIKMEKAGQVMERNLSMADELLLEGNKLYKEKKYEEAARTYEEATKLNSTQWGYYFNLGLAYKKLNKFKEALVVFQKAIELNPESYSSNKELGEIFAKSENYTEAKEYYKKATELSSDDPDAFYNLGVCLTNLGDSEEALASFIKTVELKEDYSDAYYLIGTLYIGQNKVEEAVENLEKFLELAPKHEKASSAKQLLEFLKKENQEG